MDVTVSFAIFVMPSISEQLIGGGAEAEGGVGLLVLIGGGLDLFGNEFAKSAKLKRGSLLNHFTALYPITEIITKKIITHNIF
jgi:hypothetical protein